MSVETASRTPLYDAHLALGGRMVNFAGFELPVQYSGVIAESKAVRQGAGMFDVSHMARLIFTGSGLPEFLQWLTSNDISKLADGRGQYSLLPNKEGGCVDDIIVYRIHENEFRMVVNAANHEKDVAWMKARLAESPWASQIEIQDQTAETAMIAVQGPTAIEKVAKICAHPDALREAPLFGFQIQTIGGVETACPRSGYTGEDGFELICAAADARKLWEALLQVDVVPCGLGSRDVLRVEAGLPLYGHELSDDRSPLEAGLGWVIKKKGDYIGAEHFAAVRESGPKSKLVGIKLESKRVCQPEMEVFASGSKVGEVSSGVYSPVLDCGIAFAFLNPDCKIGDAVEVDVRGKREPAVIVNKRFLKKD